VEQELHLINGPREFSISGSNNTPWKGKFRSSNIIHGSFQTSFILFHVDGELNDSEKSVDEKSKVPSLVTPGAHMAKKALKTFDNNNRVQRSTQVKYLVQILTYDGFVAHRYTYMVRVI
jgi:hypothetical protein